ncbi:MAG TPA: winged helix-turn-helix domain-containing protein [Candidatus Paceibacterota bacterium]
MRTDTRERILDYLRTRDKTRVVDLVEHLAISKQALHKHLASLIASGQIQKDGTPPKVSYSLTNAKESTNKIYNWSTNEKEFKRKDPKGYEIWRLQQMINYGLRGNHLDESAVRRHWNSFHLDPTKKSYLEFLLWPKKLQS